MARRDVPRHRLQKKPSCLVSDLKCFPRPQRCKSSFFYLFYSVRFVLLTNVSHWLLRKPLIKLNSISFFSFFLLLVHIFIFILLFISDSTNSKLLSVTVCLNVFLFRDFRFLSFFLSFIIYMVLAVIFDYSYVLRTDSPSFCLFLFINFFILLLSSLLLFCSHVL